MAFRGRFVMIGVLAAVLLASGAGATVDSGKSGRVLLTYLAGRVSKGEHPHWSYGLCLARSDGSHPVQFAPFRRNGQSGMIIDKAAWSPDGKHVALFRGSYLVVADARGHVIRKLYNWVKRTGYADEAPVWSPDGRWIAVVSGRQTQILVLPATGKGKRTIAVQLPVGAGAVESPSWTHDSKRLVFFAQWSSPISRDGIYSASRAGKNLQLVLAGFKYRYPALSPDRSKLAAVVDAGNGGSYVEVVNVDGSNPHPLIPIRSATPVVAGVGPPSWSPDGSWVAYARYPQSSAASGGIVAAAADGSSERVVVANRAGFGVSKPSWRPATLLPPAKRASCA
jgi:Tol biopolymer transport system component